jgi:DNA adenine methylase
MSAYALIETGFDTVTVWSDITRRTKALERGAYTPRARPFLKWAGGKQWLVPLADALLPPNFKGRYYEPFLGGGAIYFALLPKRACLTDANQELIDAYQALADSPEAVITSLRPLQNTHATYMHMRSRQPRLPHTAAARLIYLNKTAFNGLYRVSRNGDFNVPFGSFQNPGICNEARLRSVAEALSMRHVSLRAAAFGDALTRTRRGDLVYLDPPYITGHTNNGFAKYNSRLFSWDDQKDLARLARRMVDRGVHVVGTNADHESIRALYKGFYCYLLRRRSSIAGQSEHRHQVAELLITSRKLLNVRTGRL